MHSYARQNAWLDCIDQSLREAAWAPLSVTAIHLLAAGLHVYHRFPQIDVPMHFFGGLAMAFFLHRTSLNASTMDVIGPYRPFTHRLLVFTTTCTVAVFWEFGEFVFDRITGSFSQLGLPDTLGDLLFGTVGAGVFVFFAAILDRYPNVSLGRRARKLELFKNGCRRINSSDLRS